MEDRILQTGRVEIGCRMLDTLAQGATSLIKEFAFGRSIVSGGRVYIITSDLKVTRRLGLHSLSKYISVRKAQRLGRGQV